MSFLPECDEGIASAAGVSIDLAGAELAVEMKLRGEFG